MPEVGIVDSDTTTRKLLEEARHLYEEQKKQFLARQKETIREKKRSARPVPLATSESKPDDEPVSPPLAIPATQTRFWKELNLSARLRSEEQVPVNEPPAALGELEAGALLRFLNPTGQDRRPHQIILEAEFKAAAIAVPCIVPVVVQRMEVEDRRARLSMVKFLAAVSSPSASAALARRAIYDVSPEVRALAIGALKERKAEDFRQVLLDGFRHPWPPVAAHAAEALVALNDRAAVGQLRQLLKERDPAAPFPSADGKPLIREMVRINHLRNCLLCHAPSFTPGDSKRLWVDPVVARVPKEGEPLPVEFYEAAPEGPGIFVRADITYIRQDFSMMQRVAKVCWFSLIWKKRCVELATWG